MEPNNKFYLKVDNLHTICVKEYGNYNGIPLLISHGLGITTSKSTLDIIDMNHFRVITVDQRGCGESTPLGEIKQNNISLIVGDFERIRKQLSIQKWHILGNSWGSTLALYYAIHYTEVILSLTLSGVCLMRDIDVDWGIYTSRYHFPDYWEDVIKDVPQKNSDNLLEFYASKILNTQTLTKWNYKLSYYQMAMNNFKVKDRTRNINYMSENPNVVYAMSRLVCLYFLTCRPDILENSRVLNNIQINIVHGRYDMICSLEGAYLLKKYVPNIELDIAENSGHSEHEPEIKKLLYTVMSKIVSNNV